MATSQLGFDIFARDRASKVFDKVGKSSEHAGNRVSKLGRTFRSVGRMAAKGAVLAGGALAGLGIAGAVMGVKTAAGLQQAQIGFETMLGSAKKATAFLGDLKKFAASTPFELPGLIENSRMLIGVGIAAKDTIPLLTDFGDAAGALGIGQENFSRIMLAMSQSISAGKLKLGDMNQLMNNGLPIWGLLSRAIGKSVPEIQKMISHGQLLTADVLPKLQAQMHKDYGGAMARQSQTLSGLWSTFMDTLNLGLADAIMPLVPVLQKALPGAMKVMGSAFKRSSSFMTGTLMPAFTTVANFIRAEVVPRATAVIDAFKRFAKEAGPGAKKALDGARQGFDSVRSALAKNMPQLQSFLSLIRTLAIRVIPLIGPVLKILGRNIGIVIRAVGLLYDAWAYLMRGVLTALGVIVNGAAKAFGWVPGVGGKLKAAAKSFNKFRDDVNRSLGGIKNKHITITATTSQAVKAVAALNAQLRSTGRGGHVSINGVGTGIMMAEGGIVKSRPGGTLATLGEAGHDEAVIPLSGPNALKGLGGGGTTVIQLMGPTGKMFMQWILEAQRANGGSIPQLRTSTA